MSLEDMKKVTPVLERYAKKPANGPACKGSLRVDGLWLTDKAETDVTGRLAPHPSNSNSQLSTISGADLGLGLREEGAFFRMGYKCR